MVDPVAQLFQDAASTTGNDGATASIVSSDATGKLYLCSNSGGIKVADVRTWLLNGPWARDPHPAATTTPPVLEWPVRHILPASPFPTTPKWLSVSPNGSFALVAGYNSTTSYLWLVDLTSARPQRAHTPTPTPPRPSFPRTHTTTTTTNNDDDDDDTACSPMRDPSSQRPADVCDVAAVDPELFEGPAGLAILHVAWHPHSSLHFGVLTCDNTWRLYNVSDVSCAEQTFELHMERRKRFGLTASSQQHTLSSFAFGDGPGWECFAVYFATRAGGLYVLCPVAPFGARVPHAALTDMLTTAVDPGEGGVVMKTTTSWLQRAIPSAAFRTPPHHTHTTPDSHEEEEDEEGGSLSVVVPHALADHCPALQGPLVVQVPAEKGGDAAESRGGMLEYCEDDDVVVSMINMRLHDASVLCVATLAGCVGLHVLAGSSVPVWANNPPQVYTQAISRTCVRTQPPLVPPAGTQPPSSPLALVHPTQPTSPTPTHASPHALLLDLVDCGWVDNLDEVAQHDEGDGGGWGGWGVGLPGTVQVMSDWVVPERVYVTSSWAVTAVHIPWLPTLATLLRTNTPPTTLPPLPPPMVNELLTVQPPAGPLQGVVVVGTAITGTAVVGVTRGGGDGGSCVPVVVWPSFGGCGGGVGGGFLAATPVQSIEQGDSEEAIDTMMQRIYGDLFKGPSQQLTLPAPPSQEGPLAPDTPETLAHLTATTDVLRRKFVEEIHRAAIDLGARCEAVGVEDAKQETTEADLAHRLHHTTTTMTTLQHRLDHAVNIQQNLQERLKLLTELHMLVPPRLTAAEQVARDVQLPALEDQASQLKMEIADVARRAIKLLHRTPLTTTTTTPRGHQPTAPPPSASLINTMQPGAPAAAAVGSLTTPTRPAPTLTTFRTPTTSSPFGGTRSSSFRTAMSPLMHRGGGPGMHRDPAHGASSGLTAVPPAQMKRMRDVLTTTAQETQQLQERLDRMQLALEAHTVNS